MAELHLGTSGYQYDHWKGVFYPAGLRKKDWLDYYVERFPTVEINNTFYGLPKAERFDEWRERAPAGFVYALKFSRYGSHIKRLKDPEQPIGAFLERAERLRDRLGPILVQLPPKWGVRPDRLAGFLEAAPAARRWAVEVRDRSWLCEEVYDVLAEHGAALVLHDMIPAHPQRVTADWVYLRFHGTDGARYPHQALAAAARRVAGHLEAGRDVYAYFNNDEQGFAVRDARDLQRYVDNARPVGAGGRRR